MRAKGRELIRIYRDTTRAFIDNQFNSSSVQQSIQIKSNSKFLSVIPSELKKYNNIFESVQLSEEKIEFDYSSIENEYDIEGRIEKWYLKTRKGGDVVESMTDIEYALFGLSVDNPCGFIPQIFYPTLVEVIEAWIKKIANKYYESFIRKIDSTLSEVQNSIIENVSKHEEETNKIKGLIDKINNILNSIG